MKIKALYTFKGYSEFLKFSNFVDKESWEIEKQLLANRVIKYSKKHYYLMLKNKFYESNLTIWDLKEEEIVTWIDTISLLKRFFVELFKTGINIENIDFIMEYPLKFGNHTRSDYLIVYDRLIIVLEFGMFNQDEKRREERYTKKLQESMNYRRILANSLAKELEIVNYVMVYRPEYDSDNKKKMSENIKYNNDEIKNLVSFVRLKMEQQISLSAKSQLEALNDKK